MSDNPEITKKIEENTEKLIKEIMADQKKAISEIRKEADEKIKKSQEKIVEAAKTKANTEFLKEKAKKELELKLQITKYREDLASEIINKAKDKIAAFVGTKEYESSLEKLILESVVTLKQPEVKIRCRKEDKNILTKQFLDNVSKQISDKDLKVKLNISDDYIKTMGGIRVETLDGKINIDNTYEKRIERSLEGLKREISLLLTQEGW